MTFERACEEAAIYFHDEYDVGIDTIIDYGDFWIFIPYTAPMQYGLIPLQILKTRNIVAPISLPTYKVLSDNYTDKAVRVHVPNSYRDKNVPDFQDGETGIPYKNN